MAATKKKVKKPTKAQMATQAVTQAMVVAGAPAPVQLVDPSTSGSLFGPKILPHLEEQKKKAEPIAIRDRKADIEIVRRSINKQFKGEAVLRTGADITNVFILRRPTGITTLDVAIGGGLPAGGLTQIIGKFSSGKSYLANRIMATAQETYGENFAGAACMTEMRYDKAFAKSRCGLRVPFSEAEIEVFRQINASYGRPPFAPEYEAWLRDSVGIFDEGVGATAEAVLEMAVQLIESNNYQVVLIDSFGALLTAAEAEHDEGLQGKHRGGAAMVVTQFMHRMHAALNLPDKYGRPNTTTVIGINQYRDNVNAGAYGAQMKIAGGNALAHGKLVDLHIEQGSKIKADSNDYTSPIVGKEVNWEILKGKAGCHDGPKGTYQFFFGEHGHGFGVDIYSDLLVAGLQYGVVELNGAWYSCNGERLGQGKANASLFLYQNQPLFHEIRKQIFKAANVDFITHEGG